MIHAALLLCAVAIAETPSSTDDASFPLRFSFGAGGGVSAVNDNANVGPRFGAGPTMAVHGRVFGLETGLAFQSLLSPGDLSPSLESLTATIGGRLAIVDGLSLAGSIGPALGWAHFNFNGLFGPALLARGEVQQRIADAWAVALEIGAGAAWFTPTFAMAPAWLSLVVRFGVP